MKSSRTTSQRSKRGARDGRDLRRAFGKELRRILRRASRDPGSEDVHAVRKGITRLRSWLRLAREPVGTHRYRRHNRRLRGAARELAAIRDADVVLAAFEAIGGGASFPKTRRHLNRQARRAQKAVGVAMHRVQRRLKRELAASDRLSLEKITAAALAAALERLRADVRAAFAAARACGSVELLHTWRKRTKNYLHALAFSAGGQGRRRATARINRLLGEDHDLALLENELDARCDPPESRALLEVIAARRARLRRLLFPK